MDGWLEMVYRIYKCIQVGVNVIWKYYCAVINALKSILSKILRPCYRWGSRLDTSNVELIIFKTATWCNQVRSIRLTSSNYPAPAGSYWTSLWDETNRWESGRMSMNIQNKLWIVIFGESLSLAWPRIWRQCHSRLFGICPPCPSLSGMDYITTRWVCV